MLLFRNKRKLMPEGRWCQINVRRVQLYFYYLAKLGRRTHARNDLNINLLDFILSIDRFICACISFHFIRFFLIFWFKPWQHQLYCVIWFHFSWHLLTDRADHSWKVQFYYDICVCGLHIHRSESQSCYYWILYWCLVDTVNRTIFAWFFFFCFQGCSVIITVNIRRQKKGCMEILRVTSFPAPRWHSSPPPSRF